MRLSAALGAGWPLGSGDRHRAYADTGGGVIPNWLRQVEELEGVFKTELRASSELGWLANRLIPSMNK
jgi:hypothetical protein